MTIKCCHHCTGRHSLCHSSCERYQAEREKLDKSKGKADSVELYKRQRLNRIKR